MTAALKFVIYRALVPDFALLQGKNNYGTSRLNRNEQLNYLGAVFNERQRGLKMWGSSNANSQSDDIFHCSLVADCYQT